MPIAVFAAAFAALYAAHQVADHWIQTEHQAAEKGKPGWPGRIACATHVTSYTLTAAVALALVAWRCSIDLSLTRTVMALAISAISHYIADRRTPLRRLAELAGHRDFFRLGIPRPDYDDNPSLGTGSYALDQSFHMFFLFIAALVIA